MLFSSWLRSLKSVSRHTPDQRNRQRASGKRKPAITRLWLEDLEQRTLLSAGVTARPLYCNLCSTGGLRRLDGWSKGPRRDKLVFS